MEEAQLLKEILTQYDSEWVLLADPVVDKQGRVVSGVVKAHSKDRDEVYRKAVELKLKSSATLYTGKLAQDAAVVL